MNSRISSVITLVFFYIPMLAASTGGLRGYAMIDIGSNVLPQTGAETYIWLIFTDLDAWMSGHLGGISFPVGPPKCREEKRENPISVIPWAKQIKTLFVRRHEDFDLRLAAIRPREISSVTVQRLRVWQYGGSSDTVFETYKTFLRSGPNGATVTSFPYGSTQNYPTTNIMTARHRFTQSELGMNNTSPDYPLDVTGVARDQRHLVGGTELSSGDFSLSADWGPSASLFVNYGSDEAFSITITSAGSGQASQPMLLLTVHDGAFPKPPIFTCSQTGGSGAVASITFENGYATVKTPPMIWNAIPIVGRTYTTNCLSFGR
jgi:hypothetical protein